MRRGRTFLTPRWLALHTVTVVLAVAFFGLGWWQWKRGEAGNTRSFAYALQWPTFALFVVFMWWTLVRHELRPPEPGSTSARTRGETVDATTAPPSPSAGAGAGASLPRVARRCPPTPVPDMDGEEPPDEGLAAYNEYLARLNATADRPGTTGGRR